MSTHTVATIAAIKALTPAAGASVDLTDRDRKGTFFWRPGNQQANVANDPREGLYVAPNGQNGSGGAWVRFYEGPALVNWWGAIGDGATDCTQAFNDAWRLVKSITGREGNVYRFNGTIGSFNTLPGRRLVGTKGMTLLYGANGATIHFNGEGSEFSGWNIDVAQNVVVNEGVYVGVFGDSRGSLFKELQFIRMNNAVQGRFNIFARWEGVWYSTFEDCTFINSSDLAQKFGTLLMLDYCVNDRFNDNSALGWARVVDMRATQRPNVGHRCEGIVIQGNTVCANDVHFEMRGCILPQIVGNVIDITTDAGSAIIAVDCEHVTLDNNYINTGNAVIIERGSRHQITNNFFGVAPDTGVSHIHLRNAFRTQITANQFFGGFQGIYCAPEYAACPLLIVKDNIFDRMTREADVRNASRVIYKDNLGDNGAGAPLLAPGTAT